MFNNWSISSTQILCDWLSIKYTVRPSKICKFVGYQVILMAINYRLWIYVSFYFALWWSFHRDLYCRRNFSGAHFAKIKTLLLYSIIGLSLELGNFSVLYKGLLRGLLFTVALMCYRCLSHHWTLMGWRAFCQSIVSTMLTSRCVAMPRPMTSSI